MKQWCEQQRTRVCVPHTPYTPVLKFVPLAGRVSGAATHAVGIDAGYGLLPSGEVCGAATHAVSGDAGYGLLHILKFMPPQVGSMAQPSTWLVEIPGYGLF